MQVRFGGDVRNGRTSWVLQGAVGPLVFGALLAACSAPSEAPNGEHVGQTRFELTSDDAISRGQEWVTAKLPYCQAANHQPDYDKACASTCTRPDNVEWDPYRSDCSGFVSWSWGLPAPGRTTAEFAPAVTDITHTIDAADLQPGDAVNIPHDHMMLFKAWVTPGTRATFLEEPGCSSTPNYAHEFTSNVTVSGTKITVAYNGMTFDAIRYTNLVEADGGASGSDAATTAPDANPGHPGGEDASVTAQRDSGGSPPENDAATARGTGTVPGHSPAAADATPSDTSGCSAGGRRAAGSWLPVLGALAIVARRRRRRSG